MKKSKQGCSGCLHADWDADGCTCKINGLLVGNSAAGCKNRNAAKEPEKLIAIKGFQMPYNCIECPLQFGGWCGASPPEIDERVAPTVDEAVKQGKPKWCPLVEIEYGGKEHGT